jgi:hypothetical protein
LVGKWDIGWEVELTIVQGVPRSMGRFELEPEQMFTTRTRYGETTERLSAGDSYSYKNSMSFIHVWRATSVGWIRQWRLSTFTLFKFENSIVYPSKIFKNCA